MHATFTSPHAGGLAPGRQDLALHVPALGWLAVEATAGAKHLALPSDLFLVTVYCDDSLVCGEAADRRDLEVVVTPMRSRPAVFSSQGRGQLALALLTPLGLMQALRTPLLGITDRRIPLQHFCTLREQRALRDALMLTDNADERLQRFGHWLEQRVHDRGAREAGQLRAGSAAMQLAQGDASAGVVPAIAARLGVTRRQLERDFRRWLGVSPAHYARLARFQAAAMAIADGGRLIEAALDHGFADQSHLTRTFRELGAVTPGQLATLANRPLRVRQRAALAGRVLMLDMPPATEQPGAT